MREGDRLILDDIIAEVDDIRHGWCWFAEGHDRGIAVAGAACSIGDQPPTAQASSSPSTATAARPLRTSSAAPRDRNLWREYCRATRGLAAVRWSRGLRVNMLGLCAKLERTDEELAAEDVSGEFGNFYRTCGLVSSPIAGLDLAALVAAQLGGRPAVAALVRYSAKSSKLGAGAMSDRRHMSDTNVRRAMSLPIT